MSAPPQKPFLSAGPSQSSPPITAKMSSATTLSASARFVSDLVLPKPENRLEPHKCEVPLVDVVASKDVQLAENFTKAAMLNIPKDLLKSIFDLFLLKMKEENVPATCSSDLDKRHRHAWTLAWRYFGGHEKFPEANPMSKELSLANVKNRYLSAELKNQRIRKNAVEVKEQECQKLRDQIAAVKMQPTGEAAKSQTILLDAANATVGRLQAELQDAVKKIDDLVLRGKTDAAMAATNSANGKLQEMERQVTHLESERTNTQLEVTQLRALVQERSTSHVNSTRVHTELADKFSLIKADHRQLNANLLDSQAKIKEAIETFECFEAQIHDCEATNGGLEEENKHLEKDLLDARAKSKVQHDEYIDTIKCLREKIKDMEEYCEKAHTHLPDSQAISLAQQDTHNELSATIDKLDYQLKTKDHEIMALRREIQHDCNEITRLEVIQEKCKLSASELNRENRDLKDELHTAYKTIDRLKQTRIEIRSRESGIPRMAREEYKGGSGVGTKKGHLDAMADLDSQRPVKKEATLIGFEQCPRKMDRVVCYNCGKEDDHYFMDCMVDCGHCGGDGHKTISCPTIHLRGGSMKRKAVEEVAGNAEKRQRLDMR